MVNKNYTPHHLLLFTGIDVICQGEPTWNFHGKKEKLTSVFTDIAMEFDKNNELIRLVKPLLRPLSTMTDDEAIRITKLALDIHVETDMTTISIIPYSDGRINIKAHYYHTVLESYIDDIVTIYDCFDISYTEHSLSVFNQPHIFQYLIQCQFDIFGWIKSGIALDKTKQT